MKRLATWFSRQVVPILWRRRWKRLESTVVAYDQELQGRAKFCDRLATSLPNIKKILDRAWAALEDGNIDEGWKCFEAAQRLELFGLDRVELEAAATTIRNEAEKLNGWRKNAVIGLLTAEDGENQKPARLFRAERLELFRLDRVEPDNEAEELNSWRKNAVIGLLTAEDGENQKRVRVFRAAKVLHEHYDNEAYKDGLRRSSSLWFAIVLVVVLLALLWEARAGSLLEITRNQVDADGANLLQALLSVGLMGLLGATISAITDAPRLQSSARIPEITSTIRVIALRLLIGPSSAIVIYFLISSSLYSDIFSVPPPDIYAILIIAFAAGFTERLAAPRVIEMVTGKLLA